MRKVVILIGCMLILTFVYGQYPNNENSQYEDMITPEYYNTPNGGSFRYEVNKFINFSRKLPFQHPLLDSLSHLPAYTINRGFGDGIGPGGTGSHHPAFDYYVGTSTQVNLYAAHDGMVTISRDVARYRHYLSITTDIQDSLGTLLGKMVTLYAHIDLDLDSAANMNLNGQYVNKGDLVSKHLYSGTMGGPHLHFEIRYYRASDTGLEDFYGGNVGGNTSQSAGSWMYGFWNPNDGYGFANPENHLNFTTSGIISNDFENGIEYYPNPTKDILIIELDKIYQEVNYAIWSINGKIIEEKRIGLTDFLEINLKDLNPGIYLIKISEKGKDNTETIRVIKE